MRSLLPEGAPPPLTPALDAVAEWWAARTPRARAVLAGLAIVVAVLLIVRPRPSPWGPTSTTWVAARDLPAGHRIEDHDLRRVTWPAALLDERAVTHEPTAGTVLSVGVPSGVPVTKGHLQGPSLADRAPAGHVVVAVPAEALPDLPVGAAVDVHGGDGSSVAGGLVLQLEQEVVWLSVPRASAAALARALAWGQLLVAVVSSAPG